MELIRLRFLTLGLSRSAFAALDLPRFSDPGEDLPLLSLRPEEFSPAQPLQELPAQLRGDLVAHVAIFLNAC